MKSISHARLIDFGNKIFKGNRKETTWITDHVQAKSTSRLVERII